MTNTLIRLATLCFMSVSALACSVDATDDQGPDEPSQAPSPSVEEAPSTSPQMMKLRCYECAEERGGQCVGFRHVACE